MWMITFSSFKILCISLFFKTLLSTIHTIFSCLHPKPSPMKKREGVPYLYHNFNVLLTMHILLKGFIKNLSSSSIYNNNYLFIFLLYGVCNFIWNFGMSYVITKKTRQISLFLFACFIGGCLDFFYRYFYFPL